MINDWEKFRALTAQERLLLAQAVAALPVVSVGLSLLGWRRLRSILKRRANGGPAQFPRSAEYPLQAARMSNIAGGGRGLRATCLQRSVTLWWLLDHQGIDCKVIIGVNKDAQVLHAHAWVEHEGQPLNDRSDIRDDFAALDTF